MKAHQGFVSKFQSLFAAGRPPELVEIDMQVCKQEKCLEGLRIGQLTDLHLGPVISVDYIQKAVRQLMEHKPDVIVLTGDFVSGGSHYAKLIPAALEGLSAPLGVYAVRGNHDLWVKEPNAILDALEESGAQVLLNRGVEIEYNGSALWLAGVDDVWEGHMDLDKALHGASDEIPHLLLCHEPDYAVEALKQGVGLQLSGHTHGGQIRLRGKPLIRPLHGRNYVAGLYNLGDGAMQLYVSRGIGSGFPPLRYDCPPEVTLVTLGA